MVLRDWQESKESKENPTKENIKKIETRKIQNTKQHNPTRPEYFDFCENLDMLATRIIWTSPRISNISNASNISEYLG